MSRSLSLGTLRHLRNTKASVLPLSAQETYLNRQASLWMNWKAPEHESARVIQTPAFPTTKWNASSEVHIQSQQNVLAQGHIKRDTN